MLICPWTLIRNTEIMPCSATRSAFQSRGGAFLQIGFQVDVQIERETSPRKSRKGRRRKGASCARRADSQPKNWTGDRGSWRRSRQGGGRGVDTFITGEGPHWSFTAAEELGINLFYAGHYATEVFGVQELGKSLGNKIRTSMDVPPSPNRIIKHEL